MPAAEDGRLYRTTPGITRPAPYRLRRDRLGSRCDVCRVRDSRAERHGRGVVVCRSFRRCRIVSGGDTIHLLHSARHGTSGTQNAGLRDARVGAWLLGVSLGRDAVVRQLSGANPQSLEQTAARLRVLAARLGVPTPPLFRPIQIANANTEFVAFVETDASETARGLAAAFSPRACELFKLAALWGYSEMVRPVLPGERAVFALEIRHHARRAEVPEALWTPMMERLPANAKAEEVMNQMTILTNGVTTYLAEH